jgi:hypothetical protein
MSPAGTKEGRANKAAAAAEVGLGPNSNWAQINAARAERDARQKQASYNAQVQQYNKQLVERMNEIRQMQQMPPAAQDFSKTGEQGDKRVRKSSMRGSLLAGNTGGYNPATGGGRLGGRSLLG